MSGRYGQNAREFRSARAEAILECPELWRDWPASSVGPFGPYRSSWSAIVDFLKERKLVAARTNPPDVNVDKIVRLAQGLKYRTKCATCGLIYSTGPGTGIALPACLAGPNGPEGLNAEMRRYLKCVLEASRV